MTCLFCDLVGFTASSESADPEDVDEMLTAYSEMACAHIGSFGGVVEKFIGDAVVGTTNLALSHPRNRGGESRGVSACYGLGLIPNNLDEGLIGELVTSSSQRHLLVQLAAVFS